MENSINDNEEPKIFFFSFDEYSKYFLSKPKGERQDAKKVMDNLIRQINDIKPDIIVSTANGSLSCTSDHMLHHFTHLIDEMYKKDRNKNYEGYTPITNYYRLLAKVDSVTKKKSSNLFDYDTDFLGYTSECINDIQNTISHLRAVGKVYHRIELIQENRYYGGDYTELYLKTKITIQI